MVADFGQGKGGAVRVINSAGCVVAWYDLEDEGTADDLRELLEDRDLVELYDDRGKWVATFTGDEFKRSALI